MGSSACMTRGPKARAGLMAYSGRPARDKPIPQTRTTIEKSASTARKTTLVPYLEEIDAADGKRGKDTGHDRKTPAGGNDEPTRVHAFCLPQHHIRHDAVAEQNHDHRA